MISHSGCYNQTFTIQTIETYASAARSRIKILLLVK